MASTHSLSGVEGKRMRAEDTRKGYTVITLLVELEMGGEE